jgi:hypothetical protein
MAREKTDTQRRVETVKGETDELQSRKHAKTISSLDEHEDYPGQTLVTRSHDVIRRWAEERGAKPATVPGTEHEGHLGVLRLDFPGYDEDERLQEVSWDEWFRAFDARKLLFIYQEHRRDGRMSNFFRLDNPEDDDR